MIWFLFEAINFRLEDWYYVFLPANRLARWVGITVSLATVVPAVLLPERLLERLGVWRELRGRPVPLRPEHLRIALWVGGATLALCSRSRAISIRSRGAPCGSSRSRCCTPATPAARCSPTSR